MNYFLERIEFLKDIWFDSNPREPRAKKTKVKLNEFSRDYSIELSRQRRAGLLNDEHLHKRPPLYKNYYRLTLFKKDFVIDFKPGLNVIVGENGCGKTTIFNIIKERHKEEAKLCFSKDFKREKCFFPFDFENDNPKFKVAQHLNSDGPNFAESVAYMFDVQEESHGETMKSLFEIILEKKDSLIILDEPETALSLRNQYLFWKKLNASALENQILINTHSKVFIEESKEVLDLEKKEWISGEKYILNLKKSIK